MKKLALFAIALGTLSYSCAAPKDYIIDPGGGGNGGDGGGETTETEETTTEDTGETTETADKITAHDVYINDVHPSIIQSCGGCHNPDGQVGAPAFLDYDPELSYSLIKAYPNAIVPPAESILITKPPHTGPALSDPQKELVGEWITMELAEAGGGTGGAGGGTGSTTETETPVTLESMLEEFAACMDYDLWVAAGMEEVPHQQTNGEGPCLSCHNTGTGALWLSDDSLETFEKNKVFPYIMRLVTPIYEGSNAVDLAPSQRLFNKGSETCQNPPICHPKYDLSPANKEALESFVSTTLTKWQSGACPKP